MKDRSELSLRSKKKDDILAEIERNIDGFQSDDSSKLKKKKNKHTPN
jgi:hypothetical protein